MSAEVAHPSFAVVRRGYDRSQVDDAVGKLHAELEYLSAELRSVTEKLQGNEHAMRAASSSAAEQDTELVRLRDQVAELTTVPSSIDGMSQRLQEMVRAAQDEVNEMRSRATLSAAKVLQLAQAEADELRERSTRERQEFEAERLSAQESLSEQLAESQSRLDQLRSDSSGRRSQLEDELAQRRAEAENAMHAEVERRRATLLGELAQLEAQQREKATGISGAADEQARAKLAEASAEAQRIRASAQEGIVVAHREIDGLHTLRHQVAEQLTSVRALLDWTLPQLGITQTAPSADVPDEEPAAAEPAELGGATAVSPRAPSPVPGPRARAAAAGADQAGEPMNSAPPH